MQEAKSYWPSEKEISYTPGMDAVRQLILQKSDLLGGLSGISKALGKNHAYFQQFVHRGVPKRLPEEIRGELAKLIGVPEDALRGPAKPVERPELPPRNARSAGLVELGPATMPLMGQGKAGRDGGFVFNGQRIADILAPPALARVRDAYAVYVIGECMLPRYREGEVVYVDPNRPVRREDFVVVQIAGPEGESPYAYIKEFVSFDDVKIKLRQFRPSKLLTFPKGIVVSVHKIIFAGEG